MIAGSIWLIAIVLLLAAHRRLRGRRGRARVGAAGAGAIYGWLNEDKRSRSSSKGARKRATPRTATGTCRISSNPSADRLAWPFTPEYDAAHGTHVVGELVSW
jgi:hypothetical protein